MRLFKGYGYYWAAGIWFVGSVAGAIFFGLMDHQSGAEITADILANWQSEALSILWQTAGLAILFAYAAPQSRHESQKVDDKLNHLILAVHKLDNDMIEGARAIREIDATNDPRKDYDDGKDYERI